MEAKEALKELAKLLPDTALPISGDNPTVEVSVDHFRDGACVLISPGTNILTDGMIRSGTSSVNETLITGELKSVAKRKGAWGKIHG